MGTQYLTDIPNVEICKIALLVKSASSGGFTTDIGTWAEIASRGKAVAEYCVLHRRVRGWGGGVGSAGEHGRLNIVVYSWGSAFDRAINSDHRPIGLDGVDWNETRAASSASGEMGNLTAAYNALRSLSDGQIRQVAHDSDRGLVSK